MDSSLSKFFASAAPERIAVLLAVMVGVFGCATASRDVDPEAELREGYTVVEGGLASAPVLEDSGHRLLLFMQPSQAQEVLVCVSENQEQSQILDDLARELSRTEAPILLYGTRVTGAWREYRSGIDFYFEAVGYHRAEADRYFVVMTEYGDRFQDVFRGLSWSRFLGSVARTAARQGF